MTSMCREMLEVFLEKSKTEGFSSIAILVTGPHGNYYNWVSGAEEAQLELVSSFHDRLRAHVDGWEPFEGDMALDASYAGYHCAWVPVGFDFLNWLISQELYRIESDAPAPLKVAFWQGRYPQPNPWIDNVYRPLLKMIGAVEDDKALGRLGSNIHVTRSMAALYRIGAKLPKLTAASKYDLPRDAITITLRECDMFPHRNSDILVWYEVSKMLTRLGERVIFLRDTSKADEQMTGCEICPLASRDLDARMWLYEHSKLNFFVSNGPMMLAVMTEHIPYITFVTPEEMDSLYDANKPTFWKLKMGVPIGEQFPWAGSHQRIIWQKPTFDVIQQAYRQWQFDNSKRIAAE